jgi:hypothetical protein
MSCRIVAIDFVASFSDPVESASVRHEFCRFFLGLWSLSIVVLLFRTVASGNVGLKTLAIYFLSSSVSAGLLSGIAGWPYALVKHCRDPISWHNIYRVPAISGLLIGPFVAISQWSRVVSVEEVSFTFAQQWPVWLLFSFLGPLGSSFVGVTMFWGLKSGLQGRL